jgi:hypothetical protein
MKSIAMNFIPDHNKKVCYDCYYCQAPNYMELWCVNQEAISHRKTVFPGKEKCKFWKPIEYYKDLGFWRKLFSFTYTKLRK